MRTPSHYSKHVVLVGICVLLGAIAWTKSQAQPPADPTSLDPTPTEEVQPTDEPSDDDAATTSDSPALPWDTVWYPLLTLGVGVAVVLGLIIGMRVNAFIALITAAVVVSLMAPGGLEAKISRVASSFGSSAGGIAIVIALAAVIGKCLLDSGAADRIVRAFADFLGEKRAPLALMGSGFVLAVPVFFDTVFYLLVPLARSLYRKTGKNYLKYILAIGVGGAITHTLVPPTPGPLLMASNLGIPVGWMIMIGALVAFPAAVVGLIIAHFVDRFMPIPMRDVPGQKQPDPLSDDDLPPLWLSLLPVVLPVILISGSTIATTIADNENAAQLRMADVKDWSAFQATISQELSAEGATPAKRFFPQDRFVQDDAAPDDDKAALYTALQQGTLTEDQQSSLIKHLEIPFAKDKQIYDEVAFRGVLLNDVAKGKLSANLVRMKEVDVVRMNRALLESAYPAVVAEHEWETNKRKISNWAGLIGNANLALLISTVLSLWMLVAQRGLTLKELSVAVEESLMSGGVIILITAAGGAFGAMLTKAEVGGAIEQLFSGSGTGVDGTSLLVLGFLIAVVLKIAQGSSTVAMIIGSSMVASIMAGNQPDFHPVYIATAIGGGSLVGSWMNDSGFWIFAKMGGLTEGEALRSWTVLLTILGLTSFGISLLLANFLPLI